MMRSRGLIATPAPSCMASSKKSLQCHLTGCDRSVTLSMLLTGNTLWSDRQGRGARRRKEVPMTTYFRDPTLAELLNDPITRAVMHADGVNPRELETCLRDL